MHIFNPNMITRLGNLYDLCDSESQRRVQLIKSSNTL